MFRQSLVFQQPPLTPAVSNMFIRLVCVVVAFVLLTSVDAAEHSVYCSPAALATDQANGNIYIADETGKRVLQLDLTHAKRMVLGPPAFQFARRTGSVTVKD